MSDHKTMTPRELLSAHAEIVTAFNATGDDGETIARANYIADELDRRDAELAQLRAELARLKPLAEAAAAYAATTGGFDTRVAASNLLIAAANLYHAQAQAGEGA